MQLRQLILVVTALSTAAGIAVGGGMSWTLQDTGFGTGTDDVALGMRAGDVWPVIFSEDVSVALLPTGWQEVGMNLVSEKPMAASSPTGEVAAIGAVEPGSGKASSPSGWLDLSGEAVAYDADGRLWLARATGEVLYSDGGSWQSLPSLEAQPFDGIAIAVNGSGEVGVATMSIGGGLVYHHYTWMTGGWTKTENLNDGSLVQMGELSGLAFDAQDRPYILGASPGERGVAFQFDIVGNEWSACNLPAAMNLQGRLPVASNDAGVVGTAFASHGELYYVSNANGAGWTTVSVPTGMAEPRDGGVGLAYDYEGLPVLAFNSMTGSMWLAYDPVIAPEPATLVLIGAGGLALLRRRR